MQNNSSKDFNSNIVQKTESFTLPSGTIISILFNIIAVSFLWVRNQRSDRWISLFFMNVIVIQLLQLYENYSKKSIPSVLLLLLVFIHPLINLIGGFNYKAPFAYIEQIGIYLMFLMYIFISKVGIANLDSKYDSINWNFLSGINYYEWAFYVFFLLFSMYLYTTPQNITMMVGSYLILFICFYLGNYKFVATLPAFYNYLSLLLGAIIIY